MRGGSRPTAGRKTIPIDLIEVEKLASLNCTDEEIAGFFNVSVRTIEKRRKHPEFAEAMNRGRARGCISLRRSQLKLVEKGSAPMAIFLGKQWLNQHDRTATELTGAQGKPVKFSLEVIDAILPRKKKT